MTSDLLLQLEQKVAHAVEVIGLLRAQVEELEFLRLQVEELETENMALKSEHEKWRKDLLALIKRFDQIEAPNRPNSPAKAPVFSQTVPSQEEEFMTV